MKIHLMGIGGVGVSALARVLLARGNEVSGCDLKPSDTTPELEAARAMGVRVLTRAEMLAELIAESDAIAVAGSAGKTTVTYMIGHILTEAGFDPTVLVGDGSSSRAGRSRWLVAEVDESDGSLVLHHPKR